MQTSNLNSVIDSLRSQTHDRSVSPGTVASVFDSVSAILAEAVSLNDHNQLANVVRDRVAELTATDASLTSQINALRTALLALNSSMEADLSEIQSVVGRIDEVMAAVEAEKTRAKRAESTIANSVKNEVTRAKSAESNLLTKINQVENKVSSLGSGSGTTSGTSSTTGAKAYRIYTKVVNGRLYLCGDYKSLKGTYTAYLLRKTRKRNGWVKGGVKMHGPVTKSWNRFHDSRAINIADDGLVSFRQYYREGTPMAYAPQGFLKIKGNKLTWGTSRIYLNKTIHLPFAIVFSAQPDHPNAKFSQSAIVTNMAVFHVTYAPKPNDQWVWALSA